ncbi:flagellar hook protein FlgE [Desulfonatronum thiosulfatophilum]|uniref:Flagellar hook protein FlgE n=1 Tax=Desulfonatronum thiosulfatophilum TaxID=617002 RepID=A0A1G6E4N8_9BACT|nr:flagellar hook protein FlgE [Desulfonatronum thiosulfatophilum]SDB51895.1 flagellar hook protein FlgE [Desulfonatronum thiosulfatophilum]
MSLTASMWTGVSGLRGHGQKMGVIGNNIANVSTVGFKGSRMHFEDFMSQSVSVANGIGQVGRGVAVGAILGDFSQGSLETTNEATDVAITGNGFFLVSPPGEAISYYTRAGNFRFDKDGFLVDPHGYRVQGWEIGQKRVDQLIGQVNVEQGQQVNIQGVPGDIRLENFQSPPQSTNNFGMILNLDSKSPKIAADPADPDDPNLWSEWKPGIGEQQYSYQSTLRVYDENGGGHNLTVYFQQREPLPDVLDYDGNIVTPGEPPANKYWQFIVTVPPEEDLRGVDAANAGLLFRGEMEFNAAGELIGMQNMNSLLNPSGAAGDPVYSQNGYPLVYANFLGVNAADMQPIELNFGISLAGAGGNWNPDALNSTSYASPSTTLFQAQDGYTAGFLQNISVSREGVLTGRYSNGQVTELYALTLADFNNVWGLRREGGNLFAETRDSGPALTGIAGRGRLGTIASNALELSNVDLATEFVKMISTQKGFQANSKTITTTDMMLDEVIRMKR